jgi:hypothetical protein
VTLLGFPFRTAHRIAEGLLREAKRARRGHQWREGAVDYAIISESHADLETLLAQRLFETDDQSRSLRFTGRPYRAARSGPRSLGSLAAACRILDQAAFPRSRLFDLRRQLTREAMGADPPKELFRADFRRGWERLGAWLANWTERTVRDAGLRDRWQDALRALDVEDPGWYDPAAPPWEAATPGLPAADRAEFHTATPLGDLADAMALWGY